MRGGLKGICPRYVKICSIHNRVDSVNRINERGIEAVLMLIFQIATTFFSSCCLLLQGDLNQQQTATKKLLLKQIAYARSVGLVVKLEQK